MSEIAAAAAAGKARRSRRKTAAAAAEPVVAETSPQAIVLDAELGIEQASSLRAQLAQRIDDARAVVFDAADVQRIHTAAMQLFCLFCGDRRNAGRDVSWHRPSPALRSAAALLGVTTLLQIARENA